MKTTPTVFRIVIRVINPADVSGGRFCSISGLIVRISGILCLR